MPTNRNPNFKLSGHITDTKGKPLQGVAVRAYIQYARGAVSPLGKRAVGNQQKAIYHLYGSPQVAITISIK